jgi:serine/threonine protein kinase
VLSFVESAEMEDSVALVTESCVPFENWISKINSASLSMESKAHLIQELVWGFRCVILALNFLHSNGGLLHGNLGHHAIFVMPGGDWKIASMELACNMSLPEDVDFFCRHHTILSKPFCSPERLTLRPGDTVNNEVVLKAKNPPYYIDIYSLGQCIQSTFAELDLEIPTNLSKYIALMVHSDIKKRPTALKLSQSAVFNSDYIKLLENINELSLKSPKEALDVLGLLEPKVSELSKSMCAHKILPNVCRTLQIAINDFSNRDARESCRQVSCSLKSLSSADSLSLSERAGVGQPAERHGRHRQAGRGHVQKVLRAHSGATVAHDGPHCAHCVTTVVKKLGSTHSICCGE